MLVRLIGDPPLRARGNDVSQVVYHLYLAARAIDWKVKHIKQFRIHVCRMLEGKHPEFRGDRPRDEDGAFFAALIMTGNAVVEGE